MGRWVRITQIPTALILRTKNTNQSNTHTHKNPEQNKDTTKHQQMLQNKTKHWLENTFFFNMRSSLEKAVERMNGNVIKETVSSLSFIRTAEFFYSR